MFLSHEQRAAVTLYHSASAGNVFFMPVFLSSTFQHLPPHWPTSHRQLDYCFLNEPEWVTVKKKSIQVSKQLSNETPIWPGHIISLNPIDWTKTNCTAERYLLSRSLSLQTTLLLPFLSLSTLSWLANECRWCSGGCSGLITGAMRPRCKLNVLQSHYGERFNCPHLNKQKG